MDHATNVVANLCQGIAWKSIDTYSERRAIGSGAHSQGIDRTIQQRSRVPQIFHRQLIVRLKLQSKMKIPLGAFRVGGVLFRDQGPIFDPTPTLLLCEMRSRRPRARKAFVASERAFQVKEQRCDSQVEGA